MVSDHHGTSPLSHGWLQSGQDNQYYYWPGIIAPAESELQMAQLIACRLRFSNTNKGVPHNARIPSHPTIEVRWECRNVSHRLSRSLVTVPVKREKKNSRRLWFTGGIKYQSGALECLVLRFRCAWFDESLSINYEATASVLRNARWPCRK